MYWTSTTYTTCVCTGTGTVRCTVPKTGFVGELVTLLVRRSRLLVRLIAPSKIFSAHTQKVVKRDTALF